MNFCSRKKPKGALFESELVIEGGEQTKDIGVDTEMKKIDKERLDPKKYPLIVQHLRKEFPSKVAVEDLCLSVSQGECLGLLGENG